ncbi:hypothetical protein AYO20_07224 [Fonsecaea nubica]|uniref:Cyclase n=1 Tax=Fonsecaea nubica TaxID=856822 RepID=A0A178CUM8_9EURO|nr:hypothetical protein AYO20_07224 [Fonsecaea nubica]OAL33538.1 hypothetical protein AYO20_07224 [Fonsecaea nubica]
MLTLDPNSDNLPKRSELPSIPDAPAGALWFWGKDDELGRLNMLTPRRTAAAADLIKTGEVVSLNWPMTLPSPTLFGREPFHHEIKGKLGFANDDVMHFNTQTSSQWDGLRHVSLTEGEKRLYYNNTTQHDIETSPRLGLQTWADKGIVGRGVLIDYFEFTGRSYDPHQSHPISAQSIRACAQAQGIEFRYGDILILRTGFIWKYNNLDSLGREQLAKIPGHELGTPGVEQTEEMLDFLHDNYFSIVAADNPGFEALPQPSSLNLHLILIPLWGLGLGELFDLEKLSETCKRLGRYEFFFTSSPPNVPGGVGSYPHALAIF